MGRLANPAKLHAATGHAIADLAARTGDEGDREQATRRLTAAVDAFDADLHARAYVLCVARLARLRAESGDLDQGQGWTAWVRQQLPPGQHIRSGRIGPGLACLPDADGSASGAGDECQRVNRQRWWVAAGG